MSFGSDSLLPPTKSEASRIARAKDFGCICCWDRLFMRVLGEYHHFKVGNLRVGHRHGCVLCRWHHQGERVEGVALEVMEERYGPSLLRNAKAFHETFGSDQELLDRQDSVIGWPTRVRIEDATKIMARRVVA